MGVMVIYHRYNNGLNNPLYDAHENVAAYHIEQNM